MSDREVIFNQEKVEDLKVKFGKFYDMIGMSDMEISIMMNRLKTERNISDEEVELIMKELCNKFFGD